MTKLNLELESNNANVLLYADFKTFFGEEIKRIAKNSWHCQAIDMSHFCRDGNEFKMWHDGGFDQLKFMFTDNSKPLYYKEMVKIDEENYSVVDKKFEDKFKCVAYDYPYYEKIKPAKMEATSWNIFKVWEYTFVKESKQKLPDYDEVERIIYRALGCFKICL